MIVLFPCTMPAACTMLPAVTHAFAVFPVSSDRLSGKKAAAMFFPGISVPPGRLKAFR